MLVKKIKVKNDQVTVEYLPEIGVNETTEDTLEAGGFFRFKAYANFSKYWNRMKEHLARHNHIITEGTLMNKMIGELQSKYTDIMEKMIVTGVTFVRSTDDETDVIKAKVSGKLKTPQGDVVPIHTGLVNFTNENYAHSNHLKEILDTLEMEIEKHIDNLTTNVQLELPFAKAA